MRIHHTRSGERGIAMIVVLFMVLILSVLGSSLMFVSRTETMSSLNYKTMSQARYGAESGVHDAVNHLLWQYIASGHQPWRSARRLRHDQVAGGA